MTDEQKTKMKTLVKEYSNYDILGAIDFIRKNFHNDYGRFILNYNSKINMWVLKGGLITTITKDLDSDDSIKESNLMFLKDEFFIKLELYLRKE